jgi:hypothetical protein
MREILRLPREIDAGRFQAIRLGLWSLAADRTEAVRVGALEAHGRAWPEAHKRWRITLRVTG